MLNKNKTQNQAPPLPSLPQQPIPPIQTLPPPISVTITPPPLPPPSSKPPTTSTPQPEDLSSLEPSISFNPMKMFKEDLERKLREKNPSISANPSSTQNIPNSEEGDKSVVFEKKKEGREDGEISNVRVAGDNDNLLVPKKRPTLGRGKTTGFGEDELEKMYNRKRVTKQSIFDDDDEGEEEGGGPKKPKNVGFFFFFFTPSLLKSIIAALIIYFLARKI
jgi:hypothetical protein